eukprot:TRINITY_DN38590_c0_g1_i1.p1 TRINITY_DN38590_c0_g1~~TRINITY_DN38590_c0_g1_i1.p1  ORF type:complete len:233 (-),score=68.48 TRINITY_DN38590_c0_g1_i1:47-745(-)
MAILLDEPVASILLDQPSKEELAELDDVDALSRLLHAEGTLKLDSQDDAAAIEKGRQLLKSAVQALYLKYLAQGLRANKAAARAIMDVARQQRAGRLTLDSLREYSGASADDEAPAPSPRCHELIDEAFALLEAEAEQAEADVEVHAAGSSGSPLTPRSEASFGSATVASLAAEFEASGRLGSDGAEAADTSQVLGALESPGPKVPPAPRDDVSLILDDSICVELLGGQTSS